MARVVNIDVCNNCKECINVCPANCFFELTRFVVIDYLECLDCSLCQDVCKPNAIFDQATCNVEEYEKYFLLNKEIYQKNRSENV